MTDLELIKKMVQPLADQYGLMGRAMVGKINEATIGKMYAAVKEKGVREGAEAIIRIGKAWEKKQAEKAAESAKEGGGAR